MLCFQRRQGSGPAGRQATDKSPVQEEKGMEESLTATEVARLIDWLIEHGHTAEEATQCIKYIANGVKAK